MAAAANILKEEEPVESVVVESVVGVSKSTENIYGPAPSEAELVEVEAGAAAAAKAAAAGEEALKLVLEEDRAG